ncbi:MAG: cell division protein ZapA [Phenylobacterium sp.]|nr:cell division protein ZapA [Phenylobacterium sp.]
MAQVTIEGNGRTYNVGCEDGQEAHLRELARMFDTQVRQVSKDLGQLGDTRLFLLGALLMADELFELRGRLGALQGEVARLQNDLARTEKKTVAALEAAAQRIEKLAQG